MRRQTLVEKRAGQYHDKFSPRNHNTVLSKPRSYRLSIFITLPIFRQIFVSKSPPLFRTLFSFLFFLFSSFLSVP
ncbi:hypothetical protein B9Z19DRAFT_1083423 [Tuber borchii]|uniref:Uncharacterized protein n=1 Tax=Tuber borchii TaxID=42251 RepID=A0A2T6ZT92_TUBBO|nr:hypothetical protein B9Z19DRAFT_1083423 [Tuber borchii]